jgi:hypothetical protein
MPAMAKIAAAATAFKVERLFIDVSFLVLNLSNLIANVTHTR